MSVPLIKTVETLRNVGETMDILIENSSEIASRMFLQNKLHGENVSD
jgi:hypothetical protein